MSRIRKECQEELIIIHKYVLDYHGKLLNPSHNRRYHFRTMDSSSYNNKTKPGSRANQWRFYNCRVKLIRWLKKTTDISRSQRNNLRREWQLVLPKGSTIWQIRRS
jgi:hypothetical protein